MQRDTMFYLNTSLRSHSRPMGVLERHQLPTLNMGSDTLIFISQSHGKRRGTSLLSLSFCRDFYAILEHITLRIHFCWLNVGQC